MDFDPGNLVFFLFVAVSAAASWLQKRREKAKEVSWDEVEGPEGGAESQPKKPEGGKGGFNLEDEFKRMVRELTGDQEAPMAKPVPPPPPSQPPPVPRPIFDTDEPARRGVPSSAGASSGAAGSGMSLKEARREAERIRSGAKKVKEIRTRSRAGDHAGATSSIIRNLRSPRSAREAILATVVLGPPKAME